MYRGYGAFFNFIYRVTHRVDLLEWHTKLFLWCAVSWKIETFFFIKFASVRFFFLHIWAIKEYGFIWVASEHCSALECTVVILVFSWTVKINRISDSNVLENDFDLNNRTALMCSKWWVGFYCKCSVSYLQRTATTLMRDELKFLSLMFNISKGLSKLLK